jgi:hypothetical protein
MVCYITVCYITVRYKTNIQNSTVHVPDRRCRILPEVVLVRRWVIWVLGIWKGEGSGEGWVREGQFTSNLRLRRMDPVTATRVPSKWKREQGSQGEQGK